jgi:ADP-heptose:LPS heptosyltransferase
MSEPATHGRGEETSVLAVHPGALGDVILFGHLLDALDAPVTLAAGREKAELLADAGVVADALDFDSLPIQELFAAEPPDRARLPERLGVHRRLISCFAGGNRQAELRLVAACGAAESAFLPVRPPEGFTGHLLDLWRDLLGLDEPVAPSHWPVYKGWRKAAGDRLREAGVEPERPYHLLHPGAGAEAKRWDLEGFVSVAGELEQPVFVLGPVERERWPDESVRALRAAGTVLLTPRLTLLAGLLADAAGYVGNDSGVSHLAGIVGAPTVAVFTATAPQQFGPLGPSVRALDARERPVTTEAVLSALEELRG